eukprot:CAMPEP_0177381752 /NCGR_PEP_ID=MMETSP0368-20130122/48234_1 /TAXON_ID=447022 ORGANISM="Scrippsiella hangoei-like, Strain SHHI-4" /NCGR_SAMPLE_ID=MMETSP0368 /ASSEMBLY_ACC=CAM_ASM_000363 /LENGTH=36 /DNA_ID= /DNA_START= /DNA_END= /DNA_ORIENTATION=
MTSWTAVAFIRPSTPSTASKATGLPCRNLPCTSRKS